MGIPAFWMDEVDLCKSSRTSLSHDESERPGLKVICIVHGSYGRAFPLNYEIFANHTHRYIYKLYQWV